MVNFTLPSKNDLKEVVGLKAQIFQFSSLFTRTLGTGHFSPGDIAIGKKLSA